MKVVVVGGGITGLTAAYRLERQACDGGLPVEVTLLEGSDRLGGKLRTDFVDGMLLEHGPDALFLRTPEALELCEAIGLGDEMLRPSTVHRRAYIVSGGRLHVLPQGMEGGIPRSLRMTLRADLLSPKGKLRALLEPLVPTRRAMDDSSVDAFVRQRFGAEVADRVAGPMLGGVYSTDTRDLSLGATLPHLVTAVREHGSVIRSAWRTPAPAANLPSAARPTFVTPRRGVESLAVALGEALRETRVRLQSQVRALRRSGSSWRLTLADGDDLEADRVILAVPGFLAADLLAEASPVAGEQLTAMRYAGVAIVAVAFPPAADRHLPPGTGALAAASEPGLVAACSWTSRKWPHCAPNGELLLRCHVQEHRAPGALAMTDEALTERVVSELRALYGITEAPLVTRVYRWPRSVPSFRVGHPQRMARLNEALRALPGLELAGAGYRGIGIPECIRQGREAAQNTLAGQPLPASAAA